MHHLEVVLLDVDGVDRACLVAFAAVDAAVLHDNSFAVDDTYGLGGTYLHAARATDTVALIYLQGVVKHVCLLLYC